MGKKILSLIKTENFAAIAVFVFLFLVPLTGTMFQVLQYNLYLVMIVLSLSLTFVWGYTGIFSFCQAVFLGVGAYSYSVMWKFTENVTLTPLFALAAILIAGIVAAILGFFMFYGGINDVFVGLITLLVSLIMVKFMQTATGDGWQLHGENGDFDLGGTTGMTQIKRLQFGDVPMDTMQFFYFTFAIVLIMYLVLRIVKVTKVGYSITAIRENRERSELFGYNVPLLQTIVFAIGGAIAGLAGVLLVSLNGTINTDSIAVTASTMPLVIIATAGRKNATAAVIFTVIYYRLNNYLSATGGIWTPIIMGSLLIVVLLFMSEGLISSIFNGIDYIFGKLFSKKTVETEA